MNNSQCKTISITNSKGGVGKTTTALNLGTALTLAGKKVLLIDNDPQGNLTAAAGYVSTEQRYTLANLILAAIDCLEDLDKHLQRCILHTESNFDLIASNRRLSDAASRLQVMQMAQYSAYNNGAESEQVLKNITSKLLSSYDYIIIDCGLKQELLTVNALVASNYCIIPVQSHFFASEGIPEVLDLVKGVSAKFNPNLKVAGILLTMYQSRPQLCRSVQESVRDVYGDEYHVFERPIEYSIRLAECPAIGKSIIEYDRKNPAAESYLSLAKEVLSLG